MWGASSSCTSPFGVTCVFARLTCETRCFACASVKELPRYALATGQAKSGETRPLVTPYDPWGFVRQVLRYSTCNICWRVRGEVVVLKVKLSVEEGVGEIL